MEDYAFLEQYLNGQLPEAYRYFGAHHVKENGEEGYLFRVYAPLAKEIDLIGDFNDWDSLKGKMNKVDFRGLYELFVPGAKEFQKYKFHILGCDGYWKDKQDPFAFANEAGAKTCSIIIDIENIHFNDEEFVA